MMQKGEALGKLQTALGEVVIAPDKKRQLFELYQKINKDPNTQVNSIDEAEVNKLCRK